MKILICSLLLIASYQASAQSCTTEAKKAALEQASQAFKISKKNLSATYITGESLDGDTNSDGSLYISPSFEVFEVKNKKTNKLVATYSVSLEEITDSETGDVVECAISDVQQYEE